MPKIETVVVPIIGPVEVSVMRRIRVVADCGCWHHHPVEFDIIVPGGAKDHERSGAYVRAATAEHHFHTSDRNGPISVSIQSVTQE
jgi:hypothetical protein